MPAAWVDDMKYNSDLSSSPFQLKKAVKSFIASR